MKILLINSPIRLDAVPSCIPYGLATVAGTLRDAGFDVEIFDINALRPSREEIAAQLRSTDWNMVGVSGLITTYGFQKWLIDLLKTINPEAPVISGGGLATTSSRLLFDHTALDIAVIGEGEETMTSLSTALAQGEDLFNIAGITYRNNGEIVTTPARKNIDNLDDIPFPAWDLLPMDIYLKNPIWGDVAANSSGFRKDIQIKKSMNIISSRGCPFSCRYCYHLFGQSSYRFRSVDNVIREIQVLVERYAVDFIGFVDDNMMASKKRILEFCDAMETKNLPVTWGCHGRVTSAEPAVLNRMAETGCVWIGYGIESGSQKMLSAMNKKATVEQARAAVINTRKAGIFANTTFIFGFPGETRETIQETVAFKRELGIDCGSFFATPYPETPLYHQVNGRIPEGEAFVLSLGNATEFVINLTDFNDSTLFALKRAMDENQDIFID